VIAGSCLLLLVFSNPALFRFAAAAYETKQVSLKATDKFEAGIVLGGFVSYDVDRHRADFNPACDRFIQTALLYKTGHIGRIIVSAGNGYLTDNNFSEAGYVKGRLMELGIPASDISTDSQSRNTYENALFSKKICDSLHLRGPFLLISSALHLPRSRRVFSKANIDVRLYPCDYISQNVHNNLWEDYLVPSAFALSGWDVLTKEMTGLLIYRVLGRAN
jgi:uncharacterized SAM-binding protein YcdF (DUF218 family)